MSEHKSTVAILVVVFLLGVACGQKPGVSDTAFFNPQTGEVTNEEGESLSGGSGDIGDISGGGGDIGGPGSDDGGDSSTDAADDGAGENPTHSQIEAGAPKGGDATGVTKDTIKIGSHAPITGAAPVPSDSAEKGKDLYFRWIHEHEKKTINGRRVEVILKNDNYNPSQAVAVCKEMVQGDKVFLLSGAAGTDQIVACARYAASEGVPYLSAGVTEYGVTGLPNYFATSMTYPDQGPYLADYLTSQLGAKGEKNGMLRFDTQNFEDAHGAFASAMDKAGADLDYDRAVRKNATAADAESVVQEMKTQGIENVYVLVSPLWFLQVLQSAQNQQYEPQWVGVGITMTFDTVATVGCRKGTLNRAKFFSPFPAWIDSNKFDRDFQAAVREFYPDKCNSAGCGDDFMWLAWSGSKTAADLLEAPGSNLTRERFIYYTERLSGIKNGIGPVLSFTPEDHFGASQVHVSEAQCSGYKAGDNRWHTIQSFVSDF